MKAGYLFKSTSAVLIVLVCGPLSAQECNVGGPYSIDESTLLLLHFDGSYLSQQGEAPLSTTGTFEDGLFDQGVNATPEDYQWLEYSAADNIDLTEGTLEFWIRPNWNGNDGRQHTIFSAHGDHQNLNHFFIPKNTANNLHFIAYNENGDGEGLTFNVSQWLAGEWHHLGFTWDAIEMNMYVDAVLVDTKPSLTMPSQVQFLNFSHSVGDQTPLWGWGPDATIDEFRISDVKRCFGQLAPPVTVLACDGFAPPMASYPVKANKNRAFPLKMQLFDADGFEVTDADVSTAPLVEVMFTAAGTDDAVDVTDELLSVGLGTEGNQFIYIADDNMWKFNLKATNFTAPGIYAVTALSGAPDEYFLDPSCVTSFEVK